MSFAKSAFKYVVLPVSLIWGGLYMRYNGPEGYSDPKTGNEIGKLEDIPGYAVDYEIKYNKPDSLDETQVLDDNSEINVRGVLNISDEYYPGRKGNFVTYNLTSKENEWGVKEEVLYKLTIKKEDLYELRDFTDSICDARHLTKPGLHILFEKSRFGLLENYDQAYCVNDGEDIVLTAGIVKNHSLPEEEFAIAHELGHKILHQPKAANNSQSIKQETEADSVGLELTQDPDAAISSFGKDTKVEGKVTTLFDEMIEEMGQARGQTNYPTHLNRAKYAEAWKKKHQSGNGK